MQRWCLREGGRACRALQTATAIFHVYEPLYTLSVYPRALVRRGVVGTQLHVAVVVCLH